MRIIPRTERRAQRRTTRATLRARTRTHRAQTRINRHGHGTLATHCIAAGLPTREAATVAASLRRNATKAKVTGTAGRAHAGRHMRDCRRYTPAEVARIAVVYRPRKSAYRAAAAFLAVAA
ncbi:hypothetical protein [Streptomyces olivaceus]|uniref:hypothetical protein n=1 Tax=Streptomyces olivaceus TaxID=47716 RepID=UPI001CCA402F|nr:hypothetical protein [Streptomyces olivaceus]